MPAEYNYITGKFKKQTDALSRAKNAIILFILIVYSLQSLNSVV